MSKWLENGIFEQKDYPKIWKLSMKVLQKWDTLRFGNVYPLYENAFAADHLFLEFKMLEVDSLA